MIKQVRWLRVVIGALLIEVGLIVATIPFILLIAEALVFRVVVPVACLVVPFVIAFFATRALPTARVQHAVLMGIVATVMYFALVIGTSSIAEAATSTACRCSSSSTRCAWSAPRPAAMSRIGAGASRPYSARRQCTTPPTGARARTARQRLGVPAPRLGRPKTQEREHQAADEQHEQQVRQHARGRARSAPSPRLEAAQSSAARDA